MSVAVKEAAAPLMSVAAPLWFQKFWRKNINIMEFIENLES